MSGERAVGGQSGVTLVELLVTMVIATVVLGITLDFLVNVTDTEVHVSSVESVTRDVRFALRTISEDVRSATAVATSPPATGSCAAASTFADCLQFTVVHSTSATTPSCPYSVITYGLKGGVVAEDRVDYGPSGSTCVVTRTTTGRTLLRDVPSNVTTLFTYFDHTGAPIATDAVVGGAPPATNVASVLVTVTGTPAHGAPVTMSSLAALRNSR
jgi:prepilin-type N-terminal cleavage/methylation domain-containing protein